MKREYIETPLSDQLIWPLGMWALHSGIHRLVWGRGWRIQRIAIYHSYPDWRVVVAVRAPSGRHYYTSKLGPDVDTAAANLYKEMKDGLAKWKPAQY